MKTKASLILLILLNSIAFAQKILVETGAGFNALNEKNGKFMGLEPSMFLTPTVGVGFESHQKQHWGLKANYGLMNMRPSGSGSFLSQYHEVKVQPYFGLPLNKTFELQVGLNACRLFALPKNSQDFSTNATLKSRAFDGRTTFGTQLGLRAKLVKNHYLLLNRVFQVIGGNKTELGPSKAYFLMSIWNLTYQFLR